MQNSQKLVQDGVFDSTSGHPDVYARHRPSGFDENISTMVVSHHDDSFFGMRMNSLSRQDASPRIESETSSCSFGFKTLSEQGVFADLKMINPDHDMPTTGHLPDASRQIFPDGVPGDNQGRGSDGDEFNENDFAEDEFGGNDGDLDNIVGDENEENYKDDCPTPYSIVEDDDDFETTPSNGKRRKVVTMSVLKKCLEEQIR